MTLLDISYGTNASRAGYALRAWLIAVVPSLLYFLVLVYIGADSMRPARSLDAMQVGYSILAAPLLETALMFPVAFVLARAFPRQRPVQIVLLVALCSLAHRIGGSWEQAIASLWPFLIYSVTLNTWLQHSNRTAFVITSVVHALFNATFFGVGALGILLSDPAVHAF